MNSQSETSPAITDLHSRFPDGPRELLDVFSPKAQLQVCRDLERVFMGSAPTLGLARRAYGRHVAESWLELQIIDLGEFAGCKEKLTTSQLAELSAMLLDEYGYLKMTEFMLFFQQLKRGHYGKFYGAVDPMQITAAMREFCIERHKTLTDLHKTRQTALKMHQDAEFDSIRHRYRRRIPQAYTDGAAVSFLQYHLLGLDTLTDDQVQGIVCRIDSGELTLPSRAEALVNFTID